MQAQKLDMDDYIDLLKDAIDYMEHLKDYT